MQILNWYIQHTSINVILIISPTDDLVELNTLVVKAKGNGISINAKNLGWLPIDVSPWDGGIGC